MAVSVKEYHALHTFTYYCQVVWLGVGEQTISQLTLDSLLGLNESSKALKAANMNQYKKKKKPPKIITFFMLFFITV